MIMIVVVAPFAAVSLDHGAGQLHTLVTCIGEDPMRRTIRTMLVLVLLVTAFSG